MQERVEGRGGVGRRGEVREKKGVGWEEGEVREKKGVGWGGGGGEKEAWGGQMLTMVMTKIVTIYKKVMVMRIITVMIMMAMLVEMMDWPVMKENGNYGSSLQLQQAGMPPQIDKLLTDPT